MRFIIIDDVNREFLGFNDIVNSSVYKEKFMQLFCIMLKQYNKYKNSANRNDINEIVTYLREFAIIHDLIHIMFFLDKYTKSSINSIAVLPYILKLHICYGEKRIDHIINNLNNGEMQNKYEDLIMLPMVVSTLYKNSSMNREELKAEADEMCARYCKNPISLLNGATACEMDVALDRNM